MFDSYNEYLSSFKKKLSKHFGDSFTVPSLREKVDAKKISLSAHRRIIEAKKDGEYSWVKKVGLVIEKIMAIASNPRSHIKAYKDIKNVDAATKIENKDIMETIKMPKFWKPLNNEMLPEYVYCDNYDMELAIYENRFIISLIDLLNFFLMISIQELYTKVKFLGKNYSSNRIQLGLMDGLGQKRVLTQTNEPYALLLKKVIDFKKKLSMVFSSSFYKVVKKSKPLAYTDIHATNMLLGDASYSVCFAFYRKYLTAFHKNEKNAKKNNIIYYDYALVSILFELMDFGFEFNRSPISIDDSFIKEECVVGKNKNFEVTIDKKENRLLLTFAYRHRDIGDGRKEKLYKKYTSVVSVDIIPTYLSGVVDDDDMNEVFEDTLNIRHNEGYDNAFIITSIDMVLSKDVIYLSPMNKKVDSNLKNLISSILLSIKGDKFIYSHLCPVCGSHITPTVDDGERICPMCHSRYSLFDKKSKRGDVSLIWVKKVNGKQGQ